MTTTNDTRVEAVARAARATESFHEMRQAVAKTDALIAAAEQLYTATTWGPEVDAQRVDRIAHLLQASCDAAEDAIVAVDRFNSELSDSQLLTGGQS